MEKKKFLFSSLSSCFTHRIEGSMEICMTGWSCIVRWTTHTVTLRASPFLHIENEVEAHHCTKNKCASQETEKNEEWMREENKHKRRELCKFVDLFFFCTFSMEILHAFGNKMSEFRFRSILLCEYAFILLFIDPLFLMRMRARKKRQFQCKIKPKTYMSRNTIKSSIKKNHLQHPFRNWVATKEQMALE